MFVPIHIGNIVLAAVVYFIVGFLMHGPVAGKLWMRLANVVPTGNEKFPDMIPQMVWNFLVNIVSATILTMVYFLALFAGAVGPGIAGGAIVAFWMWLGFVVTHSSLDVIWMKQSRALWAFEIGSALLGFVAMGMTLAVR